MNIEKLTSPFRTSIGYQLLFCFILSQNQRINAFEPFFGYLWAIFRSPWVTISIFGTYWYRKTTFVKLYAFYITYEEFPGWMVGKKFSSKSMTEIRTWVRACDLWLLSLSNFVENHTNLQEGSSLKSALPGSYIFFQALVHTMAIWRWAMFVRIHVVLEYFAVSFINEKECKSHPKNTRRKQVDVKLIQV